ncbi:tetratricopeptide repeat protein, partial [bacterium]|nr:tetratricopeptide repeat protein [bacterium]
NDYSRAVELQPNETRYHNMRGLFLLTRQQYDGAESDFTAAVQTDPKYVQAWNNRGLVKLARGDYQAAIGDFNKAVEIDPNYADGFNNRGFAWFQAAVDAKALADFNRTIELKPDFVNALNNRGMLYMKLQKFQAAADDFSEAIRLDEANVKHYQNRRAAYQQLGLTSQADADAERIKWLVRLGQINTAVAQNPNRPDVYIERANHLAEGGRHEIALTNFERAINVAPERSTGWISRAKYWLQQGEPQKAVDDATKAIEKSESSDAEFSHLAFSIRGDAYFLLGKFDEAIADYGSAKRIDLQVAQAYLKRAGLRNERGDKQGAQADYQQALTLDPTIGERK